MLRYKGVPHRVVYLAPRIHPALLRFAGFEGATVPALDLGERKVQGSRSISRALETVKPEPRLFPADPEQRYAVEEAERWGEEELQETVGRIFRWAAAYQPPVRRWPGSVARWRTGFFLDSACGAVVGTTGAEAGLNKADFRDALFEVLTQLQKQQPSSKPGVRRGIWDGAATSRMPNAGLVTTSRTRASGSTSP